MSNTNLTFDAFQYDGTNTAYSGAIFRFWHHSQDPNRLTLVCLSSDRPNFIKSIEISRIKPANENAHSKHNGVKDYLRYLVDSASASHREQ